MAVTPDSPPSRVHRFWQAAWWRAANALAAAGVDCTVLDPDAARSETWYDGDPDHGTITVHPHRGAGWSVLATESDADSEDP